MGGCLFLYCCGVWVGWGGGGGGGGAKADPGPGHRAPAPLFETFWGVSFCKFWRHNTYTFIVVSMQCLLYLFYHQLSLQKHRICVKGHQNILRHQEFYRAGTTPPGFEITVSATGGSRRRGGGSMENPTLDIRFSIKTTTRSFILIIPFQLFLVTYSREKR